MTTGEHLKAIGRITLEFGTLEWLLDNLLVGVNTEFKTKDAKPTGYDSLSKRVNLIAFRVEKKFPDRLAEWHTLERGIGMLAKERHRLLHSVFEQSHSPGIISPDPPEPHSPGELLDLATKVSEMNAKVSQFLESFSA